MNKQIMIVTLVSFLTGALFMIVVRGAGLDDAPRPLLNSTSVEETDRGAYGEMKEGAEEAPEEDHSGHNSPAAAPENEQAKHAPSAEVGAESEVFVCAQDHSIGMSYADTCPLDGAPMIPMKLDLSTFKDLANDTCPIMGGASRDDIFALYKGQKIRFCCKGCGATFFKDPESNLKKIGGTQ